MACRKRRHPDRGSALLALDTIQRKFDGAAGKVEQRAYPCRFCRGWHLTAQARRPR
jgi:hypothetical protein